MALVAELSSVQPAGRERCALPTRSLLALGQGRDRLKLLGIADDQGATRAKQGTYWSGDALTGMPLRAASCSRQSM
jgi:hypothetical protein